MSIGDVQLSPEELNAQLAAAGAPASVEPPPLELAGGGAPVPPGLPVTPADNAIGLPVAGAPGALPLPAAPPITPAPPGMHVAKGSRAVEHVEADPNLTAGFQAGQAAIDQKAAAAKLQEPIDQDKARIEAERADAVAQETARQNMLAQAEEQARQDKIDAVNADIDTIQRRVEANRTKAPAGFEGWSGLEVALGAVSVLGALVSRNGGGIGPAANAALGLIDRHVAREFNAKKAALEEEYKALAQRQGYSTALENQAKDAYAHLTAQRVQALDYIGKYYDAQMKALGPAGASQAAAEVQAKFAAEKAAQQENLGKILSTKVTDTMQVVPGRAGAGGGGGGADRLSKLHAFANAHQGPDQEALVVAESERLFPELRAKPEELQTLVAGAVKAAADAKTGTAGKAPAGYTDVLSGQTLPIGPNTDGRQHNEATAKLKPINTFLATANKLLAQAKKPGTPEWAAFVGADVSDQAGAAAAITRLRSAYAAAKGESVGEGNSAHLATAIPDPPTTGLFGDARMKAWRRKIEDVVEEMTDLRKEGLANAGVPLDVIEKVAGGKGAHAAPPAANEPEIRVAKDGSVLMRGPDGKIVKLKREEK
jgi:hypothetical protein